MDVNEETTVKRREYTQKQKEWAREWDSKNLDRMSLAVPKGYKERLRAAADERGLTVNGLLRQLIESVI